MADDAKDKAPTLPEVKDTPPSRDQLEAAGFAARERGGGEVPKTEPSPDLVLPMNLHSTRTQGLLKNEWPTIRSAELRDGVIRPIGSVENQEALNRLKEHLIQEPGVESIDTSGIVVSSDELARQRDKAAMNAMRMASAFGETSF